MEATWSRSRLPDLWMDATGDSAGRRGHAFAIEIKPILLPVRRPTLLESVGLPGGGDTESSRRQDHGTNTDVWVRAFANMPAPRTPEHWGTDVPLGSNSLKRRVQVIAQLDDCVGASPAAISEPL